MEAYQYPDYYAIALAPSDPAREVEFFEAVIEKFSKAKVRQIFELGAGTAPYLEEWHKRIPDYRVPEGTPWHYEVWGVTTLAAVPLVWDV